MLLTEAGIICQMGEGNSTVTVDAEKLTTDQVDKLQQVIMCQYAYMQSKPDPDAM